VRRDGEPADARTLGLRVRRERPSGRSAAEQRDEIAPVVIESDAIPHDERGRTAGYRIGRNQSAGFISVRLSRIAADSELADSVEGEQSALISSPSSSRVE
jgi:hypothetical protein